MARDPSDPNRVVMVGSNSRSLVTEDGGQTFVGLPHFGDRNNELLLNVQSLPNVGVAIAAPTSGIEAGATRGSTLTVSNGDLSPAENVSVSIELPGRFLDRHPRMNAMVVALSMSGSRSCWRSPRCYEWRCADLARRHARPARTRSARFCRAISGADFRAPATCPRHGVSVRRGPGRLPHGQ